jgi:hypothetical protein
MGDRHLHAIRRTTVSSLFMLAVLGALADEPAAPAQGADQVVIDTRVEEVRFPARVQYPRGKPCIDTWGQRVQAFLGSEKANGTRAEFADDFVFVAGADTEQVYRGIAEIGINTRTHFSRAEGRQKAGKEFLEGDPVAIVVRWTEGDKTIERRYEEFVQEKVVVDGKEVVRPWTPHFVFHGSGVIHKEGTGCIACPCDCPGGLIADNRNPVDEPKPTVRFDLSKAPPEGSKVTILIRPLRESKPK